jgi:hypothetical protein
MIAFVGSSMANTIDDKEVILKIKGISEKSESKIVLAENCNLVQYRSYNLARDLGYAVEQANVISYQMYFRCAFNNSKEISISL